MTEREKLERIREIIARNDERQDVLMEIKAILEDESQQAEIINLRESQRALWENIRHHGFADPSHAAMCQTDALSEVRRLTQKVDDLEILVDRLSNRANWKRRLSW